MNVWTDRKFCVACGTDLVSNKILYVPLDNNLNKKTLTGPYCLDCGNKIATERKIH